MILEIVCAVPACHNLYETTYYLSFLLINSYTNRSSGINKQRKISIK